MEEIHFNYWLANIPGIGNKTIEKLLQYAITPQNLWYMSKKEYHDKTYGLKASQIEAIVSSKNPDLIIRNYDLMEKKNIHFSTRLMSDFPQKLVQIPDAPFAIYFRGSLPNPDILSVAIVGARNCSEYGRYVARKIGSFLADSGIQVISGLARGIDSIAQNGALIRNGYSCAVLGCGVDICYPLESREIYDIMSTSGGIISEYPPGTKPSSKLFPQRNRLISGLSDVIVVIEAREHSGSLITADMALEQGKEIYALPGRVTDSLSHGTNRLIRQGAGIILSPEEFLNDLSVNYSLHNFADDPEKPEITLNEIDKKILQTLSLDPQSLAVIQSKTKLSIGELTHSLILLTTKGFVKEIGGQYTLNLN